MPEPRRRALLSTLVALFVPGVPLPLRAQAMDLRVVVGDSGEATSRIVAAIARRHPDVQTSQDAQALAQRKGPALFVAVGPAALQAALEADVPGPLVSTFVSSESYARLLKPFGRRARPVTAIHAEAAPACQMQLIRELYGRRVLVGALLGPSTIDLEPLLNQSAQAAGLDFVAEHVEREANPVRALAALTAAVVLLTVPDRDLYTAQTLRPLLESTYRRGQGVIGFSTGLVNAGALAAAYASIDDVVAHLDVTLAALSAGRNIEPQYPMYWRVMFNDSVARSLNIRIDSAVRALGRPPP